MGHSSKMSGGYQPTWQAGADQNFQGLQSQLSSTASNLASYAPQQYGDLYKNVQSNPYYPQAQQGADFASMLGATQVAPQQLQGASNLAAAGDSAGANLQDANKILSSIMSTYGQSQKYVPRAAADASVLMGAIPQATAGYGLAMPSYQDAMSKANQTYGLNLSGLSMIPGMVDAAGQVLNTGFDPQNQLYDRSYQQLMEQQNAINAQQGVSGSPFAAGVAGQTASNFNLDWQNQQLQRQLQALSGYTSTMGTAGNLASNFINGAASDYGSLAGQAVGGFDSLTNGATSNLNSLVTNADQMIQSAKAHQFADWQSSMNGAVSRYGTMSGIASNDLASMLQGYAGASDLGAAGLNTITTSAMYPNEVYMNQQNQILQALNAMVGGTGQALAPLQGALGNDLNYMKTGQSATQLQQNATSYNNAQQQQQMAGFGQLAGLALAPFTGGMSLGLGGLGGQMLGGAGNSLGGLSGIGAGLGLSPVSVMTSGVEPAVPFSM